MLKYNKFIKFITLTLRKLILFFEGLVDMQNNKYVLNFTPTGMIPTKEMSPHVPITPQEITKDVLSVIDLGVNMIHLHARDPETGKPTFRKEVYQEIIQNIRKYNKEIILGVSTSGRNFNEFVQRADCLDLEGECKPDIASLTLSSLNFNKEASINSPQMIQDLSQQMLDKGIKPELEAFDVGMINYAKYLIRKGLLKAPYYFNLILGNIAGAQANLLHLGMMINELPQGSFWSVGGVGEYQLELNSISLASGGGIRIGLEDNIWFDTKRTILATNREFVERAVAIAKALGREPYQPRELRRLLKL
jgi:3-keto-5-aminohexanoate cleavage enzyme